MYVVGWQEQDGDPWSRQEFATRDEAIAFLDQKIRDGIWEGQALPVDLEPEHFRTAS